MQNNTLSIVFLISVNILSNTFYASDTTTQQYTFNDFDRDVFTNYTTNKVELAYPTPLIESVSNDPITIRELELKMLVYPALTRIVYKQKQLFLTLSSSTLGWAAETYEQKEQVKKYWDKQADYATKLDAIYEKTKAIEALKANDKDEITLPANDFMLLVQYAAKKIEHYGFQSAVVVDSEDRQKCFLYDETKKLLEKYRPYEQKAPVGELLFGQ